MGLMGDLENISKMIPALLEQLQSQGKLLVLYLERVDKVIGAYERHLQEHKG